jgi:hypothetical protein
MRRKRSSAVWFHTKTDSLGTGVTSIAARVNRAAALQKSRSPNGKFIYESTLSHAALRRALRVNSSRTHRNGHRTSSENGRGFIGRRRCDFAAPHPRTRQFFGDRADGIAAIGSARNAWLVADLVVGTRCRFTGRALATRMEFAHNQHTVESTRRYGAYTHRIECAGHTLHLDVYALKQNSVVRRLCQTLAMMLHLDLADQLIR